MAQTMGETWEALPVELSPHFRAEFPRLATLMVGEIQRNIPEFARPLDGTYNKNIRIGIERALNEFADRMANGGRPWRDPESAEVYRALGRGEVREGRTLDALQSAYRLGARLGWQCLVEVGARDEVPPAHMYRLAEAVFAYIDELADHTREGYLEAQARVVGELQRRRERLLDLLIAGPTPSLQAVTELARAARWPLPQFVRVVAYRPTARPGQDLAPPVPPGVDALLNGDSGQPYVVIPDPGPGGRATLERALRGRSAAIGPPVPVVETGASLRWARQLLTLSARGVVEGPVVHCVDHLPLLVLLGDEALIRTLATRRLAPLDGLTPRARRRLAETLLAWLEYGAAPEVARLLQVHPQTVRYRLRQLEDLFGDAMRDPHARFELELALRARTLLASRTPVPPPTPPPNGVR